MKIHVVVPIFRETDLLESFLKSWEGVRSAPVRLLVVNGDPGDSASRWIADYMTKGRRDGSKGRRDGCGSELVVEEVPGNPELFWTGLVCLGLERVAEDAEEGDFFVLTNVDVNFSGDPIEAIRGAVPNLGGKQVSLATVTGKGGVHSSGVVVRSWILSLNRHLLEGMAEEDLVGTGEELPATYLPTRFLFCPTAALKAGHFPDADRLPHYCADYEYTNRLRLNGYAPVVFTGARIRLHESNTGFDTFLKETDLRSRIARAWDIKCPYNFRYRYRFVKLVYPAIAFYPGLLSHFAKIFLEIVFGGRKMQRLRTR